MDDRARLEVARRRAAVVATGDGIERLALRMVLLATAYHKVRNDRLNKRSLRWAVEILERLGYAKASRMLIGDVRLKAEIVLFLVLLREAIVREAPRFSVRGWTTRPRKGAEHAALIEDANIEAKEMAALIDRHVSRSLHPPSEISRLGELKRKFDRQMMSFVKCTECSTTFRSNGVGDRLCAKCRSWWTGEKPSRVKAKYLSLADEPTHSGKTRQLTQFESFAIGFLRQIGEDIPTPWSRSVTERAQRLYLSKPANAALPRATRGRRSKNLKG